MAQRVPHQGGVDIDEVVDPISPVETIDASVSTASISSCSESLSNSGEDAIAESLDRGERQRRAHERDVAAWVSETRQDGGQCNNSHCKGLSDILKVSTMTYSLVRWKWFSDITWWMKLRCNQSHQSTYFTAPGCWQILTKSMLMYTSCWPEFAMLDVPPLLHIDWLEVWSEWSGKKLEGLNVDARNSSVWWSSSTGFLYCTGTTDLLIAHSHWYLYCVFSFSNWRMWVCARQLTCTL